MILYGSVQEGRSSEYPSYAIRSAEDTIKRRHLTNTTSPSETYDSKRIFFSNCFSYRAYVFLEICPIFLRKTTRRMSRSQKTRREYILLGSGTNEHASAADFSS